MAMNENHEIRLRHAVARLINEGLRTKVYSTDDPFPVDPDDLSVWEVVKYVRNDTLSDIKGLMDELRLPKG